MKKYLCGALTVLLLLIVFTVPAMAAQVYVDGQRLNVATSMESGATLVPLRSIFQALGASVDWDGQKQTVTATKAQLTIKLQIGIRTAYRNGQPVALQVPGKIIKGNTMVPLRFVSEALGASVKWDGPTKTITIISAGNGAAPAFAAGNTKVHFIDVGQADAIYISMPNHNDVLIDGGNITDGPQVVNYLNNQGVDDIELLIATHPHEDHIGGLPDVLNAFAVERIIDSGCTSDTNIFNEYQSKAKSEKAVWRTDNDQIFTFGNNILQIITSNEVWEDINDYSVVCRLDTGDIEFLFTGDAEGPAEDALMGQLDAEILKVGHHGSSTSSATGFLNRVKPKVAVISVGTGNTYGHPAAETVQRLQSIGAAVYRTDLHGNVIVSTDGQTYSVQTAKQATGPTTPQLQPQPAPVAPVSSGKYIGSTKSDKYHHPDCAYAKKIEPVNQIWFKDAAEAKARGYQPCGVCKP